MNSSRKGARGERELAILLHSYGFDTERGGTESFGAAPDLSGLPGIHIEVKRVEKLNIQDAIDQSIRDSKKFNDGVPTVFHRRNKNEWLVTMRFMEWIELYKEAYIMTHWKKLTNPDYMGSYSLEDGKDIILTVDYVSSETVTSPEGKKEICTVVHWKEDQKPMILNVTNAKMISKLLKTPYIEEWRGHRLQIGSERIKAFGELVEALRVRAFLPSEDTIVCEACGGVITGSHGMDARQLAEYTKTKYKRVLCGPCAMKEAKK